MKKRITLTELDPAWSKITHPILIRSLLMFNKEYWKKVEYSRVKNFRPFSLIENDGLFLTGFLPRIRKYLNNKGYEYEFDPIEYDIKYSKPNLPGIVFREDQLRQINSALKAMRGVLLAPTGSGKTILIAGLISCFPGKKILFLCHTVDLVDQAIEEFKKFKFKVSKVGDGKKDTSGDIVVSTIQTFSKMDLEKYCDMFDVVFCDECHHMSKFPDRRAKKVGGSFYKVLSRMITPARFAVTATYPVDPEVAFCLEGLIGPVVDELSFREAVDLGILAVPEVVLVPVEPFSSYEIRKYADIYDAAIVNNEKRNMQIIKEIKKLNRQGLTTLTYVNRIDHVDNLLITAEKMNTKLYGIQGSTPGEIRLATKKLLQDKTIKNVVATVVWKEGINIRSLNAIIIGGGGKNEKDLIQSCGRGARKDEGKDEFIIVDFVDSAKYLSQHFCERLKVYIKKGWI